MDKTLEVAHKILDVLENTGQSHVETLASLEAAKAAIAARVNAAIQAQSQSVEAHEESAATH